MRTTLSIDPDVFAAAKAIAESSGKSIGRVLSELARRGLRPRRAPTSKTRGLPTFEVSSDAPMIPANRAAELIADEGLDTVS